jgi:hypothetical protein
MRTQLIKIAIVAVVGTIALFSAGRATELSHKPQLPLLIRISPVDPRITPETLQPGDVVEFRVSAVAVTEADEMRISIGLEGGAEVASGPSQWKGKTAKGEETQLIFNVRVPRQGTGKIRATVTLYQDGEKTMKRSVRYYLGAEKDRKDKGPASMLKKDSKGRNIIEY